MTKPFAHSGRSFDVSGWNVVVERRAARTLAARRNYLKCVMERVLLLVENVEIDGALVVYSNDCFVQGILHRYGSQLRAARMFRWPSFSRSGSKKLPRFHH